MAYDEAFRSVTLNADSSLAGYTGVPGTPGAANPNYGPGVYRFVKIVGKRTIGRSTGTTDTQKIVGVNQSKPQVVGEACTVAIRGECLVFAGAAVAAGDIVKSDGSGRAITSSDGTNALGIAVEDASGANTLLTILLRTN